MNKQKLLLTLKQQLLNQQIITEEILTLLSEIRCYFCQNPTQEKEIYTCSFWNGVLEDKRLICYICLRYSYKRNLPLIAETKQELFLEYEQQKLF